MIKYDYEDGRRGFEAKLWIDGRTLKIKIYGSDHGYDWRVNLKAWPREQGFHRGWYAEAEKLAEFIDETFDTQDYDDIAVLGHSAGGAIASILPYFMPAGRIKEIITVNAPGFGSRRRIAQVQEYLTAHVRRGDVVRLFPLLYRKPRIKKYGRFTWFWRAHNDLHTDWDRF